MGPNQTKIPELLERHHADLLSEWLREQRESGADRSDLLASSELRQQSTQFLGLLLQGAQARNLDDISGPEWDALRGMLADVSRSRARQGFTPTETAQFVLSFKKPFQTRLRQELGENPESLFDEVWLATSLLDRLALWTTEVYQKAREEVIFRQQKELLELSTPVVKLWDGILALPMIGVLDSSRTQVAMEALLQTILDTSSEIAIIDITGVPIVDTLVAQHLLKTVAATRLMGAECIISGIRPQIAQTIVHLAIDLSSVITKATLADAFKAALQRLGQKMIPVQGGA